MARSLRLPDHARAWGAANLDAFAPKMRLRACRKSINSLSVGRIEAIP